MYVIPVVCYDGVLQSHCPLTISAVSTANVFDVVPKQLAKHKERRVGQRVVPAEIVPRITEDSLAGCCTTDLSISHEPTWLTRSTRGVRVSANTLRTWNPDHRKRLRALCVRVPLSTGCASASSHDVRLRTVWLSSPLPVKTRALTTNPQL